VVLQEEGYIISRFLLGGIVMALIVSRVLSFSLIRTSLQLGTEMWWICSV